MQHLKQKRLNSLKARRKRGFHCGAVEREVRGSCFSSPLSSRLAANIPVPGVQAGGQEVQLPPHPCAHPGTSEQSCVSTQVSHTETSEGQRRMHGEESTQPPIALTLPGLRPFRKQGASLFLLRSGPIFISFLPTCVRESPEAHHKDHLFLFLPPSPKLIPFRSPACALPAALSPAATLLRGHCSCPAGHPCACACVCKHTRACVLEKQAGEQK